MRKNIFLSVAMIIFIAANFVTADTREIDPATPLDNYISVGEWNTPGDRDGWNADNQLGVVGVAGGSITGTVAGADPWLNKALASGSRINLPASSVFEIRIKYDADAALSTVAGYFYLLAGTWNPIPYAVAGEIPTDGQFHVYRLTVSAAVGNMVLTTCRVDPIQGADLSGLGLEIDYVRIQTPRMVDPTYRAGYFFASANSLADWDTPGDLENWALTNIDGEQVAGGYLTATNNGDGNITKDNVAGLPAIDLDSADNKIIQIRMRNTGADTGKQLYFGTSVTPGISGARSKAMFAGTIPTDGNFHIYQFDMSDDTAWTGTLQALRFDPASIDPTYIEIDYIHAGSIIPEPATFGLLALLGLAFLRRK